MTLPLVLAWLFGSSAAGPQDATSSTQTSPARAYLEIHAGGLVVRLSGKEPKQFAGLRELAAELPGLRGEFVILAAEERPAEARAVGERIQPLSEDRRGVPVSIDAGDIPVLELLRFLADYTGLPVLLDTSERIDGGLKVAVAAPIAEADDEVVKAILEANQFRVEERELPGGQVVLGLSSRRESPVIPAPREKPIVIVDESSRRELVGRRRAEPPAGAGGRGGSLGGVRLTSVPKILLSHLDLQPGMGLLVQEVDENVPRDKPDLTMLKRYDVITHVCEVRISSVGDLQQALAIVPPGELYHVRVLRRGTTHILRLRR